MTRHLLTLVIAAATMVGASVPARAAEAYDCLIEVDGQTLDEVNQTVMRIREMSGVDDTVTCLVVQSWQRPDD